MTHTNKSASEEINRLATLYKLRHVELSRHCQYFGEINGRKIRVNIFDRDPELDLAALENAIDEAEE